MHPAVRPEVALVESNVPQPLERLVGDPRLAEEDSQGIVVPGLDAVDAGEVSHSLDLDHVVVHRVRRRPLHTDDELGGERAAHAQRQIAQPHRSEVVPIDLGVLLDHDLREAAHRLPQLALHLGRDRLHQRVDPRQVRRRVLAERGAKPLDDRRFRRLDRGIFQGGGVAPEEGSHEFWLGELVPAVDPAGEPQGDGEPHEVQERRSLRGIVEIGEPPAEIGDRVLLDVGVSMQVQLKGTDLLGGEGGQLIGEEIADAPAEGNVDESEVAVRVGEQTVEQLGVLREVELRGVHVERSGSG